MTQATLRPIPSSTNGSQPSMWLTSAAKFIPKKPTTNVIGRNTVATAASCLLAAP